MIVNKDSWHYKAYSWTYDYFGKGPPDETNLCQYTRRVTILPPLIVLVMFLLFALCILMYVALAILAIPALIIGMRPTGRPFFAFTKEDKDSDSFFVSFSGLKIPGMPFRLHLWHLVAPAFLIFMNYVAYNTPKANWVFGTELFLFVPMLIVLVAMWFKYSDSETMKLFRANVAAKKSMICPLVTFDNKPTSTDISE